MATITPHADAVRQGLADMRARYDAELVANEAHAMERRLTLGFTELAMTVLGETRDQGVADATFGHAAEIALGNVIASLADTLTNAHPIFAGTLAHAFANNAGVRAMERLRDRGDENVNSVVVAARATSSAGRA